MATGQGDGYTQDGYTIEESSNYGVGTHKLSNVFDHNTSSVSPSDSWLSGQNTYGDDGTALNASSPDTFQSIDGSWIGIRLPKKIKLSHIHLYNLDFGTTANRPPKTGIVWASNNSGSSWNRINDFSCVNHGRNGLNTVNVNSATYYDWYRVQITEMVIDGDYTNAVSLQEVELYGYEEGSGSLDTTLKTVYNVPATTGTQLEVYYDGRETSSYPESGGTTVYDISPNTNNGTLDGVGFDSTYKAFTFDGTDDRITATYSGLSSITDHTLAFWMKVDSTTSQNDYVVTLGTNNNSGGGQMIAFNLSGGTLSGKLHFDNWGSGVVTTDSAYRVGEWVHVVGTMTGIATGNIETQFIYVNGIKRNCEPSGTSTLNLTSRNEVTIGVRPNNAGNGNLTYATDVDGINYSFDGSIANVRFYSKALNADQVKELYDYQKDYFLGSKSQVTLYKGRLGVGVTEPSGQLELAGDERIQEYPPGPMSDYDTYIPGHGVFCASAINESANNNNPFAWKAFNKETSGSKWWFEHNSDFNGAGYQYGTASDTSQYANPAVLPSTNGVVGLWIELKMPYAINLKSYALTARSIDALIARRMPEEGVLFGSNDDGTTWTAIHNHKDTGGNYEGGIGPRHFNIDDTSKSTYSCFRFVTTKLFDRSGSIGTSGETPNIGELKFFGTPGPTTLDKGSLTLGRSLDVPRVSRYDVDTETPRPEKLVVDFDTTVNSSPTDISGKGNHGVFYGTNMRYSSADKAFVFNGLNDYINSTTGGSSLGNFIHSVSMWINSETTTDIRTVFFMGDGATENKEMQIQFNYTNNIAYLGTQDYWLRMSNFPDFVNQNQWHHIAYTYNGTNTLPANTKFYIDGKQMTLTGGGSGQLNFPSASERITIGAYNNGSNFWDGKVSNFKLYSVALEPSEVKKLYNLGRTGRSMVISDTAVGIGKAPGAQLDVRGVANFGSRVGIGTTDPNDALHVYGSPFIQHQITTSTGTNDSWYIVGTWNASPSPNDIGAEYGGHLHLVFLGGQLYGSNSGGRSEIIAKVGNTSSYKFIYLRRDGEFIFSDARLRRVGTEDFTYDICVKMKYFTNHTMRVVECSRTTSFVRKFESTSEPLTTDTNNVKAGVVLPSTDVNGSLAVGTITPSYTLDVNGTLRCFGFTNSSSDDRIKYNEQNVSNALTLISQLKPQKYEKIMEIPNSTEGTWIPTDEEWENVKEDYKYGDEFGFIAQDVRAVPELAFLVNGEETRTDTKTSTPEEYSNLTTEEQSTYTTSYTYESNTITQEEYSNLTPDEQDACTPFYTKQIETQTPLALNYQGLFVVAIGAIQELKAKNDALEARIAALEGA
jgi:hypothetical protein